MTQAIFPSLTQIFKLRNITGSLALAAAALALSAGAAAATTYTVDSSSGASTPNACTAAPSDCTLQAAIGLANAGPGGDTIDFDAGITSVDTDGPIALTKPTTVDGAGNVTVVGTGSYPGNCTPNYYAFDTSAAAVRFLGLAIHTVCGRAIYSPTPAPTIQVGPRRADDTVPISGRSVDGNIEIFRADAPAASGEALSLFKSGLIAGGGGFSWLPPATPAPSEKFAATVTPVGGGTSTFSVPASAPADLSSPALQRAVAISNNTVRLDFSEPVSTAIAGATGAFALNMGGVNREVTNVGVDGSSVYVVSVTTPWATGDAGGIALTGNGRVTDPTGNELLGLPSAPVFAGPGELTGPVVSRLRLKPSKFCKHRARKCKKRKRAYLYLTLDKPARVVFTVRRTKGAKFVVRWVHKLDAGTTKSRLNGSINGRSLPATNLTVDVVAEDVGRNFSVPVSAGFKVVTRDKSL